ncbi:MAG: hypothetical protein ACE5DI_03700 [Candidatus Micrarchaeia archaeon]
MADAGLQGKSKQSESKQQKNGASGKKPLLLLLVLAGAIAIAAYFFLNPQEGELHGLGPAVLDLENYPRILLEEMNQSEYVSELRSRGYPMDSIIGLECTVPFESSIVNLAHIKKTGDSYEISCQYGEYYDLLLRKNRADGTSYNGIAGEKILSCTPETAKRIDEVLKTPKKTGEELEDSVCELHVQNSIPQNVDEYYFLKLVCTDVGRQDENYDNFWAVETTKACFGDLDRIYFGRTFVISADKKQVLTAS